MMPPFTAYAVGLCFASVCTDLPLDQAAARLNADYPTGVTPWKEHDGPFADGSPNPSPCQHSETHRHILFSC